MALISTSIRKREISGLPTVYTHSVYASARAISGFYCVINKMTQVTNDCFMASALGKILNKAAKQLSDLKHMVVT